MRLEMSPKKMRKMEMSLPSFRDIDALTVDSSFQLFAMVFMQVEILKFMIAGSSKTQQLKLRLSEMLDLINIYINLYILTLISQ